MLHLSSEVSAHIFSFIPEHSDLKTLRLVCPRFSDLAATSLFHTLRVGLFPKYLKRLNAIAAHPYLRLCVRMIRFYGDLLNDYCLRYDSWYFWIDYELVAEYSFHAIWRAAYNDRNRELLDLELPDRLEFLKSDQCFQKLMGKYHRRFTRLYKGQKQLLDRPLRTVALLGAVSQFSGLITVEIDAEFRQSAQRHSFATDETLGLESGTLLQEEGLFRGDGPDTLTKMLIWLDSIIGMPSLRDLSCHAIPWGFWCHQIESRTWAGIDARIADVLSNVQTLSLTLTFGYLGDFRKDSALWRLWSFLQTPTQLATLHLEFQKYYGEHHELEPSIGWGQIHSELYGWYTDLTMITPLLENLRLPHLRTLKLNHCEFSQVAFVHCMTSHALTLKEVHLGIIRLSQLSETADSWEAAIRSVAPAMRLEKVELNNLQDNEIDAYRPRDLQHLDDVEAVNRRQYFLDGVASYLLQGGQAKWPTWSERSVSMDYYCGCCRST